MEDTILKFDIDGGVDFLSQLTFGSFDGNYVVGRNFHFNTCGQADGHFTYS